MTKVPGWLDTAGWGWGLRLGLFADSSHTNTLFFLLKHRQVLLEIFSKNYRVRRNMIQSRLTQECGEELSKQEVDKVLKVCPLCTRPHPEHLGLGTDLPF